MRSRKSTRLADRSGARDDDQGQTPPPVPENWQQLMADMQARLQSQDEHIRILRQAPSGSVAPAGPPALVPVVQPVDVGNKAEPLYERFRNQQPPIFEGGPNPLKVKQWITMITIILDFMRVEGHDRVDCATYMLREDARIWWEVASQTKDVTTLSWDGFNDLFSQKYNSGSGYC